jgi:hypothetical protein
MSDQLTPDDAGRSSTRPPLSPSDAALPPVEPPSAGFIVQLFVVPALIVAAVIGVYLLFGRLAASDVDWRELVIDLRSDNRHTRWRGANGLAQLLEADALRRKTTSSDPQSATTPLTEDDELANELAATLTQELARPDADADQQRLLEYLIKSLGWMEVPDVVLPALTQAWEQSTIPFLKQQALIAIGVVAGRAHTRGRPLNRPELTDLLTDISRSETGVLRHVATYNLGFLADERAQAHLRALLSDADPKTRINAAIGITRSGSQEALSVFEGILQDAAGQSFDPQQVHTEPEAEAYFERKQLATNALTAAESLRTSLTAEQRARWVELVEPLTQVADVDLQRKAIEVQYALRGDGTPHTGSDH